MKYIIIITTIFLTTNAFSETAKKKKNRAPNTAVSIRCTFDNNGENKKDVSPNKPGFNGSLTNEHTFQGHTMSVYWNPGSSQETQTALAMTLNGVNSVVYDINLEQRNSPINVMTADGGLIRFQCGVER